MGQVLNWTILSTAQKIIKIAQEQDELAADGTSSVEIFFCGNNQKCKSFNAPCNKMITIPKILNAYCTEACNCVQEHMSKQSLQIDLEASSNMYV